MAKESALQFSPKSVGISVEGVVGVGGGFDVVVMHTERFLDVAAMDLDDPAALLGKAHLLGVVPVDPREKRRLLTDEGSKPACQVPAHVL
jgi:hypothetical protein